MAEEAPQPFERVFGGFKAAVSSSFKLLRNVGRDKTDAADSVDTPEEPDEQAYSEALLEQPSDGFGGPKCPLLPDHDAMVVLQLGCTGHQDMEHRWRVVLWRHCIESFAFGAAPYSTYLQQALPVEVRSDIKKDCPRTYPSHQRFACPEGRRALRNVLTAYAAYDPDVGYCQGMNFLAGLLLMNLPTEALAFEGLVLLMKGRRLDGFFGRDMTELQVQLWQLGQLMPPRLARHLEAYGVMPVMFAASWLMTCFSSDFNTDFSARIMDVVLGGSCDAALLKVAVAVLQRAEAQLLGMHDLEALLLFLKVAVPAWDSDTLHQVLDQAFARPWTRRQLQVMAEGSASKAETVAQTVERVTAQCLRQAASASTPGSTAATPSAAAASPLITPLPSPRSSLTLGTCPLLPPLSSHTSLVVPLLPPPPSAQQQRQQHQQQRQQHQWQRQQHQWQQKRQQPPQERHQPRQQWQQPKGRPQHPAAAAATPAAATPATALPEQEVQQSPQPPCTHTDPQGQPTSACSLPSSTLTAPRPPTHTPAAAPAAVLATAPVTPPHAANHSRHTLCWESADALGGTPLASPPPAPFTALPQHPTPRLLPSQQHGGQQQGHPSGPPSSSSSSRPEGGPGWLLGAAADAAPQDSEGIRGGLPLEPASGGALCWAYQGASVGAPAGLPGLDPLALLGPPAGLDCASQSWQAGRGSAPDVAGCGGGQGPGALRQLKLGGEAGPGPGAEAGVKLRLQAEAGWRKAGAAAGAVGGPAADARLCCRSESDSQGSGTQAAAALTQPRAVAASLAGSWDHGGLPPHLSTAFLSPAAASAAGKALADGGGPAPSPPRPGPSPRFSCLSAEHALPSSPPTPALGGWAARMQRGSAGGEEHTPVLKPRQLQPPGLGRQAGRPQAIVISADVREATEAGSAGAAAAAAAAATAGCGVGSGGRGQGGEAWTAFVSASPGPPTPQDDSGPWLAVSVVDLVAELLKQLLPPKHQQEEQHPPPLPPQQQGECGREGESKSLSLSPQQQQQAECGRGGGSSPSALSPQQQQAARQALAQTAPTAQTEQAQGTGGSAGAAAQPSPRGPQPPQPPCCSPSPSPPPAALPDRAVSWPPTAASLPQGGQAQGLGSGASSGEAGAGQGVAAPGDSHTLACGTPLPALTLPLLRTGPGSQLGGGKAGGGAGGGGGEEGGSGAGRGSGAGAGGGAGPSVCSSPASRSPVLETAGSAGPTPSPPPPAPLAEGASVAAAGSADPSSFAPAACDAPHTSRRHTCHTLVTPRLSASDPSAPCHDSAPGAAMPPLHQQASGKLRLRGVTWMHTLDIPRGEPEPVQRPEFEEEEVQSLLHPSGCPCPACAACANVPPAVRHSLGGIKRSMSRRGPPCPVPCKTPVSSRCGSGGGGLAGLLDGCEELGEGEGGEGGEGEQGGESHPDIETLLQQQHWMSLPQAQAPAQPQAQAQPLAQAQFQVSGPQAGTPASQQSPVLLQPQASHPGQPPPCQPAPSMPLSASGGLPAAPSVGLSLSKIKGWLKLGRPGPEDKEAGEARGEEGGEEGGGGAGGEGPGDCSQPLPGCQGGAGQPSPRCSTARSPLPEQASQAAGAGGGAGQPLQGSGVDAGVWDVAQFGPPGSPLRPPPPPDLPLDGVPMGLHGTSLPPDPSKGAAWPHVLYSTVPVLGLRVTQQEQPLLVRQHRQEVVELLRWHASAMHDLAQQKQERQEQLALAEQLRPAPPEGAEAFRQKVGEAWFDFLQRQELLFAELAAGLDTSLQERMVRSALLDTDTEYCGWEVWRGWKEYEPKWLKQKKEEKKQQEEQERLQQQQQQQQGGQQVNPPQQPAQLCTAEEQQQRCTPGPEQQAGQPQLPGPPQPGPPEALQPAGPPGGELAARLPGQQGGGPASQGKQQEQHGQ